MDGKLKSYAAAILAITIAIYCFIAVVQAYLSIIISVIGIAAGAFIIFKVVRALAASRGWGGGFKL